MEGFWNAWQELSKSPENTTARVLVKERALAMTDAFNQASKQLQDLSQDLTTNIGIKATEANTAISQIAKLNEDIYRIEGLGDNANDLRDQRDLLMDNLSKIINISYTEDSSGYNVKMGNVALVTGNEVSSTLTTASLQDAAATGDLNSGEINGMIQSRDKYVANYQFQFDAMLKSMVQGDIQTTLPKGLVIPEGTILTIVNANGTTTPQTFSGAARTLTSDLNVIVKVLMVCTSLATQVLAH